MPSLREQLLARQLPTADVAIPADPVGYAAAERAVEVSLRALQDATVRQLPDQALVSFREHHAAAAAHLAAQPAVVFHLRCLPVSDWEALVDAHPPTEEQRARGWMWSTPGFRPALLAACVAPPEGERGLTEADWRELACGGQIAQGELDLLFVTAVNLNARHPQVSTGKG